MTQLKKLLDALFNSPYLDKADVAYVVSSSVVLFKLGLPAEQQAALVGLLSVVYIVGHKIENALTSK